MGQNSESYQNSTTSIDINVKLGPLSKLEQRNIVRSKMFDDDVMSQNYDTDVIFQIYCQFEARQKLWPMALIFRLRTAFYPAKVKNKTRKPSLKKVLYLGLKILTVLTLKKCRYRVLVLSSIFFSIANVSLPTH